MNILNRDVRALNKIHWIVTLVIRISLALAAVGAVVDERWRILFVICLAFFFTFLPRIFHQKVRVRLPVEIELVIVLFVYATLFLGDVHGYYAKFWWWDSLLHAGSGLVLGIIGFLLAYMLYKGKRFDARPWLVVLFAFCFSVTIGTLWEITEFAIDGFFGSNMQKSGLVDTMWDLILDSAAALVAAFMGFLYLHRKNPPFFDRMMQRFIKENPEFFK